MAALVVSVVIEAAEGQERQALHRLLDRDWGGGNAELVLALGDRLGRRGRAGALLDDDVDAGLGPELLGGVGPDVGALGQPTQPYFTVTFFCAKTVFGTKPAPAASGQRLQGSAGQCPLGLVRDLAHAISPFGNSVNCNTACMPMAHDLLVCLAEETHGHIDHQVQEVPAGVVEALLAEVTTLDEGDGAGAHDAGRLLHRAGVLRLRAKGSVRPHLDLCRSGRAGGRARRCLATEVASEPVLVVRGEDGTIRALSAICQHRGEIIPCPEKGKALRCPLHFWTYDFQAAWPARRAWATPRPRPSAAPDGAAACPAPGALAWLHLRQSRP